MSNQKRLIVLTLDGNGGMFVKSAPDDVVIALVSYSDGELAIDGMNLDNEDVLEELEEMRIEVRRNIVVGHMGDGTEIRGDDAFRRYVLTKNGLSHPGHYGCHLTPEEQAEEDALFEQYVKPLDI